MVLWIVFAFMTAAAILAVCWPFVRRTRNVAGGSDLLVYKDQLLEIDRDRASGLIGESEAEAARLEVSRRLLAAANASPASASDDSALRIGQRRRAAILSAAIVLALGAPGLYVALGLRISRESQRLRACKGHLVSNHLRRWSDKSKRIWRNSGRRNGMGSDCAGLPAARPL